MTRTRERRGGSFPILLIFTVTLVAIILRMTQAQPQHFFKANLGADAPVSKSLPRIGRRSDLETFPLPLPPSPNGPGENNWQGGHSGGGGEFNRDGEEGYIIPFLDDDHLPPNSLQVGQFLWRKLMGGNQDPSEIRTYPSFMTMDGGPTRNMYRSRTRK